MEHTALFEERVNLTPLDLRKKISSLDKILLEKLALRLENKCSRNGFVLRDTLKILSRSMGYVEKGRFTGDIIFHIQAEGKVLNPPAGIMIEGVVIRKNKMGIYVSYDDAIRVILPRDLHIGDEAFENVNIGDRVNVQIQKSRFQVNDTYILSVGLFRGVVAAGASVAPVAPVKEEAAPAAVSEEEEAAPAAVEEEEEEAPPAAAATTAPENENLVILNNANSTGQEGGGNIEFYSSKPEFKEFSNFYSAPFTLDGKAWPTVEHYFQAAKFPGNPTYQEQIRQAKTAAQAKKLGASKEQKIREDWDAYRISVMEKAVRAKFEQNESLRKLLLSTGNKELAEASPTDYFWGIGKKKNGENRLGKILMNLRKDLASAEREK
jgi:ribA/ribD-fused uncharacterized protein